jgi:hypothetical protein
MAGIGSSYDEEDDPITAAAKAGLNYVKPKSLQSNFPAVNQFTQPNRNTAFARNAPINTLQQNFNQIPIGAFGLGALQNVGYSRSPQMNIGNFLNRGQQQYTSQVPQIQYTLPGVNADIRALSDPSVGALEGAQRSTNQYGQNVINPVGGGQIISGAGGPNYGSLQGSTPAADAQNRPGLNTPSGGQAFAGPSLRKPMDKMTPGQTWSLGGWY